MKHLPFDSIYRPDFEVVEQREGNLIYYPHTEQLPVLLRALNLEFSGALPDRVAGANARTDGLRKIMLYRAAVTFCNCMHSSRPDRLRLFPLVNPNLVAKVAIVQQITEATHRGRCHSFRFYSGQDFFPEIYLSGKRVVFAEHVLERFSSRVPNNIGEHLAMLLLCFFSGQIIALPVGAGRAFILQCGESILAFTYKESDTEYFITTCLTVNEINSLRMELPPQAFSLHYGSVFKKPEVRNWSPIDCMLEYHKCWESKTSLPPPKPGVQKNEWYWAASWIKDFTRKEGHGPGSQICFLDNIPGPCVYEMCPGQKELQYNELEVLKQTHPDCDWEKIIAERDAEARRMTPKMDN